MKEKLIELSKEKGFESKIYKELIKIGIWIKLSNNHAYYLWMCELQKWLRENHNIHIFIHYNTLTERFRIEYITHINKEIENEYPEFNTYEQALGKGLYEGLKLIK